MQTGHSGERHRTETESQGTGRETSHRKKKVMEAQRDSDKGERYTGNPRREREKGARAQRSSSHRDREDGGKREANEGVGDTGWGDRLGTGRQRQGTSGEMEIGQSRDGEHRLGQGIEIADRQTETWGIQTGVRVR